MQKAVFTKLPRDQGQRWGVQVTETKNFRTPGQQLEVDVARKDGTTVRKKIRILKVSRDHFVGIILE